MKKTNTEKFFELIIDKLPLGVAVNVISTGEVLYINKSMRKIYSLEKTPKNTEEFYNAAYKDSELKEEIKSKVIKDVDSHDPSKMTWEHIPVFVEGEPEKYITVVNIPLYECDLMISTVKDVTSEVKAYEALEESEMQLMHAQKMEAIGRLAANVAHDFNNLIGVIKAACFLISEKVDSKEIIEEIKFIRESATSAEKLTYQLNVLGRKHKTEAEVLGICEVLSEFEDLLNRLVNDNIKLVIKCDKNLGKILIDKNQLQQAFVNLVINSTDALPDGGRIVIEAKISSVKENEIIRGTNIPPGEYIIISVLDNGMGMDSEVMQHIFEPFYTTKEDKGTGLGLSIVYGFVKKWGGYIYANSIVGEGTIFEVYFPVHS